MEWCKAILVIWACNFIFYQVKAMPANAISTTTVTSSKNRSSTTSNIKELDDIFWKIVKGIRTTKTTLCNPQCMQRLLMKRFKEIDQKTEIPMYTRKPGH